MFAQAILLLRERFQVAARRGQLRLNLDISGIVRLMRRRGAVLRLRSGIRHVEVLLEGGDFALEAYPVRVIGAVVLAGLRQLCPRIVQVAAQIIDVHAARVRLLLKPRYLAG